MKLQITTADNGYILKSLDTHDGSHVFEVFENENASSIRTLIYSILDYFGETGGRYDEERVYVEIRHGDKYECNDKQCTICKEE